MHRDDAIATLRQHEAELRRLGVQHLYLFGSTARGEVGPDSDVDLFLDHEKGKFSLFDVMEVEERTTQILGRKADVMTRNSLHKMLRSRIEASALQIFCWQRIRSPFTSTTLSRRSGASARPWATHRWRHSRGIGSDYGWWNGYRNIPEASRHLPPELQARHSGIPWQRVAGIGNILRHDYRNIAPDVLWALARDHLKPLERACLAELAREVGDRPA